MFPGSRHMAVSSLSKNVPVLSCSGLTKRFLVPGWRTGWIIIHDRQNRLAEVSKGLRNLCGRILGSNTLVQGAIPEILEKTPQCFFDSVIKIINENAIIAYGKLKLVRGLNPIMPNGAMYMMVGLKLEHFPEISDDITFIERLVNEQSVFCLPGSCFEYPSFMRIVLTVPRELINEACDRIADFCESHYKPVNDNCLENTLLNELLY